MLTETLVKTFNPLDAFLKFFVSKFSLTQVIFRGGLIPTMIYGRIQILLAPSPCFVDLTSQLSP